VLKGNAALESYVEQKEPNSGNSTARPHKIVMSFCAAQYCEGYGLVQIWRIHKKSRIFEAGSELSGNDSDIGRAIAAFADACARSDPSTVADEYQNLFVGLVGGELVPNGS